MRAFIEKTGRIKPITTEHAIYAVKTLKKALPIVLKTTCRISTYSGSLAFETLQKGGLTPAQKTSINRLFRRDNCSNYVGSVNNKLMVSDNFGFTKSVKFI